MPISLEVWPGGWQNEALQDLVNQINNSVTNITTGAGATNGEIGAGFDARPYELGYADPVQAIAPFDGTIIGMAILADRAGSCVVQVYKSTVPLFPTFTSIVGIAPPTLSSVQLNIDTTLTGWNKSVKSGDIFLFTLQSASTIQEVTVHLFVQPTSSSSSTGGGSSTPVVAGVSSVSKSGSPHLIGDVTLSEGANITLTQSGNNIAIASSGGGGGSPTWNPVLFAQPSGTHLAANTLLIMDSATD